MTMYRIEKYNTKKFARRKQYRFRIVAIQNGKIVASGEGYYNRADRDATVVNLRKGLGKSLIVEL